MDSLVIIGNGSQASLAKYYFERDTELSVSAFVVDKEFQNASHFENLPLITLDEMVEKFPPADNLAFVAVGYSEMNNIRETLCNRVMESGYNLTSYISPRCTLLSEEKIGYNCLILEDNTIQPRAKIGNNVTLWSGNHIGHDTEIEDNCFITSHVVISGFTKIKNNSFIGVNATLRDDIIVGEYSLIGAGSVIMQSTEPYSVILPPKSTKLDKKSTDLQIS